MVSLGVTGTDRRGEYLHALVKHQSRVLAHGVELDLGPVRLHRAQCGRVALDAVNAPTLLVDHAATLRAVEANWPKIKFHAMREHAGLVFHKSM
jgi:hypothetical protein